MNDYVPPWGPSTTDVPPSIKAPKPSKYVNTPYGPVLRTQLGRGPTFSPGTAKQFAPGQIVGGYIDSVLLQCVPIIPNPIKKENDDDGGGGGGNNQTKPANNSNFIETFFIALPDLAIEEKLSLVGLTGNELLEVSHRENFYTTNSVLNSNIMDLVDTLTNISPKQIIKLQDPNLAYFKNNLYAYTTSVTTSNAIATITIPISEVQPSYKIEVENFAPKYIKNDTIY